MASRQMLKRVGIVGLIPFLAMGGWGTPAFASGPYLTDDASLTTVDTAQFEAWMRAGRNGWETWILPATRIAPNLELTLGSGTERGEDGGLEADYVAQLKTLFRETRPNDWGIGLAAGGTVGADGRPAGGPAGGFYAYIPASLSLLDGRVLGHLNLGTLYDSRQANPWNGTWSVRAEGVALPDLIELSAEWHGDMLSLPYYQAGVRYWLAPPGTRLDLTVLGQANRDVQISLGISLFEVIQRKGPQR
ncbi:MAG: hypothetical protein VKP62_11075 [Candidatus Sericytochromatia bacterium]|nr:hypothetical protein [Candidatus Sericytochromatia bacterium]